jgi:hypothetical protein
MAEPGHHHHADHGGTESKQVPPKDTCCGNLCALALPARLTTWESGATQDRFCNFPDSFPPRDERRPDLFRPPCRA